MPEHKFAVARPPFAGLDRSGVGKATPATLADISGPAPSGIDDIVLPHQIPAALLRARRTSVRRRR